MVMGLFTTAIERPPITEQAIERAQELIDLLNTPFPNKDHRRELFEIYHEYYADEPSDINCGDCVNSVRDYMNHRIEEWESQ